MKPGSWLGALLPLLAVLVCACRLIQTTAELPGKTVRVVSGKPASSGIDPVLLQQRLMRFADDFGGAMIVAIDALREGTNPPSSIELQRLRLSCVGGCCVVVSGPNEMMNLADLFRLVSLTREFVEERWLSGPYGESARPMLEACRRAETNITQIAASVLQPQQLEELRASIPRLRLGQMDIRSTLFARGFGAAAETGAVRRPTDGSGGGILSLLMIDPLAGLDPAARELAQTRLFAERALFVAQRTPMLLRWQTELLVLETAESPAVREVRSNTSQVAQALERTSKVVEEVPTLVRSEREEILKAVASQESGLTNVVAQLKAALDAGRQMSDSLNTTLTTADRLQQNLRPKETAGTAPPPTELRPFRIQDYTEAAERIDSAAERLTRLFRTFDETLGSTNLAQFSAQVTPAFQQAGAEGRATVDYAFRKAVLLVVITCALVLASASLFQCLRRRRTTP